MKGIDELNRTSIGYVAYGVIGTQLTHYIEEPGALRRVVFDDKPLLNLNQVPFADYTDPKYEHLTFYVTLGYHHLAKKRAILEELRGLKRNIGTYIHPTCSIDPSAEIGEGSILYPGCIVGPKVKLGAGVFLHTGVTLSHDITIGAAAYLSPGVIVSGNVAIGAECFLGTGTMVSNGIAIGERSKIGIGSVITKSLPDASEGLGNPFRPCKFDLR